MYAKAQLLNVNLKIVCLYILHYFLIKEKCVSDDFVLLHLSIGRADVRVCLRGVSVQEPEHFC